MLSTSLVDALKAHGHILVVKGGAVALARELDEILAPAIAHVEPHLGPRGPLSDEPTSSFGDERIDQLVEDAVAQLTRALMRSDHVEDVFAEDAVIRRDIFRTISAGLLSPAPVAAADPSTLTVKLDALGYVAATVSRRADPGTLQQALDRAAATANARFSAYSTALREVTFRVDNGGPDARLDLEEAVADELTDLAEQGVVDLPTIERRVELGRALSAAEQRALGGRLDAAAAATLLRSGCAAAWDFADADTIVVTFTPLSEQDALGVDAPSAAFAREIGAILATLPPPASPAKARPPAEPAPPPAPETAPSPSSRRKAAPRAKAGVAKPRPAAKTPSRRTSKPAAKATRAPAKGAAAKTTKTPAKKA